jgi:murein DD-endopeptidase MepM/ murein hydrolase activator NlpD
MDPETQARNLNSQWLANQGKVTQMPGPASPDVQKYYSYHQGYDFGVPAGTPLTTPQDYVFQGEGLDKSGFGNRVALKDPNTGEVTYLSHLSKMTPEKPNATVPKGTIIGYTGGVPGQPGAGNTTGPHVDITIDSKGKQVAFLNPGSGQSTNQSMPMAGDNSPAPNRLQALSGPIPAVSLPPISNTYSPQYMAMLKELGISAS